MPTGLQKLSHLVRLLPQHPVEFWDRVSNVIEFHHDTWIGERLEYERACFQKAIQFLQQLLGIDMEPILADPAVEAAERDAVARSMSIEQVAPFGLFHNADFAFARMCFAICRALSPAVVVETGVGYGVTTSFILAALEKEQLGRLVSIDLPPLGVESESFVGFLVPNDMRRRWRLCRGQCRRLLPHVLAELDHLDVFVHDSLHTYRHMNWEFRSVWPKLRPGGVLISDDVDQNGAFLDFAREFAPGQAIVVGEASKPGAFGVAVKPGSVDDVQSYDE
jgi:predicted O-methyltransferase YrrM